MKKRKPVTRYDTSTKSGASLELNRILLEQRKQSIKYYPFKDRHILRNILICIGIFIVALTLVLVMMSKLRPSTNDDYVNTKVNTEENKVISNPDGFTAYYNTSVTSEPLTGLLSNFPLIFIFGIMLIVLFGVFKLFKSVGV